MNLIKKIAFNTIWQIGGKLAGTLLGLVAMIILAKSLGVEKFGWYSTAIGFMQFIAIMSDFGFSITTSSMLANPRYEEKKLINTLFTLRFLTGLIFNGLSVAIIWFFPYRTEIKIAASILSLSFFFVTLNQIFWGFYQQKLKMNIPAIAEFLSRLVLL